MLVRASLEGDEYSIAEARNGDESIELARRLRPDLIVLDVMMPGRSGLEVLTELRGDQELAGTLVIMLTARTQTPTARRSRRPVPTATCRSRSAFRN